MLFLSLTKIVGLGNIFLIICQLLMSVTDVDSKSRIRNQLSTFKRKGRTMEDGVTPRLVLMKSIPSTQRVLRRTRQKRDFLNNLNKCFNPSINVTSTCTPFFIRRTKVTHRKTARLKEPNQVNTTSVESIPADEVPIQKQEKSKIKKLLFFKHTLSSAHVTDSSELINGKSQNKYDTTKTLNPPESLTERIFCNESCKTSLSTTEVDEAVNKTVTFHFPGFKKHHHKTDGPKTDLQSNETAHDFLSQPFTEGSIVEGEFSTEKTESNGSYVSLINEKNKTTNLCNTSTARLKFIKKLKNIFHIPKASSFSTSESDRLTTFGTDHVLQQYDTLDKASSTCVKVTKSDKRDHLVTDNNIPMTSLLTSTPKTKRFHVHHKQKDFSTSVFTVKPKNIDSTMPVLTADILETQVPSPLPKHPVYIEGNTTGNFDIVTKESTSNISTESGNKYFHFHNMLHMHRRTTLEENSNSSELEQDITLSLDSDGSKNISRSILTSPMTLNVSKSTTASYQGNGNLFTHLFHFRKHKFKAETESDCSISESSISEEEEVMSKSPLKQTVDSKINSKENSSITESLKTTTVHSPFKIKYLIKFKSPITSTQSEYNKSTALGVESSTTYDDKNQNLAGAEHVTLSEIASIPTTTPENVSACLRTSTQLDHDSIKHKSNKNQYKPVTTRLRNALSNRNSKDNEHNGSNKSTISFLQTQETKGLSKLKNLVVFKKRKPQGKNKYCKHNNNKHLHKQVCCHKQSTEDKNRFNVTVQRENKKAFRDWFFGKTTIFVNKSSRKNEEECSFKWCYKPGVNNNQSIANSNVTSSQPLNNTPEMPVKSSQTYASTLSSVVPENKLKHFFHFRANHIFLPEDSSTEVLVSNDTKEQTICTNTKAIQPNKTAKTYTENNQTVSGKMHSHKIYSPRSKFETTPVKNLASSQQPLEITTLKSDLTTSNLNHNASIKVYGHGKLRQIFHRFHSGKMNLTENFTLESNERNNILQTGNDTVILNPDYADYVETKLEKKKHKKHSNRTVVHNASDVNDTSFNVMAFVMKPFDSLVSVFKAHSPNSVTKIGDVNATDIKNGSLPHHLRPLNSSIVILAVNNTNGTSKDIHESKLGMALDLLGGMYHCMFNSFADVKPEDVHFYLYTRGNPEEPEEIFLPESSNENITNNTELPLPVLERENTSQAYLDKREVENDDNEYEDYEFETLNPAKSGVQSKWFNVHAKTKVLIHGYLQDYQTDIMVSMREAYLSQGWYNVVIVDWSVLVGDSSCYPVVASRGLRQVGGLLAQLLNQLIDAGVSPSDVHLVGFSLGAHVAGHAGTFMSRGLVSRITGLDPALPYVPMEPDVSLDEDDAAFVDIIHSAAGLLGQSGPMGHVDFYPNGGSQQPGCEVSSLSCSHRRAALYFIESINTGSEFAATKCDSWHHFQATNCSQPATAPMGERCPADTRGKYYLMTSYRSPFALLPEEHVKVKKSLLLDLFYDSEDL